MAELGPAARPLGAANPWAVEMHPSLFSRHQGYALTAGSVDQALLVATSAGTAGIHQRQHRAPGKGAGGCRGHGTSREIGQLSGMVSAGIESAGSTFKEKE